MLKELITQAIINWNRTNPNDPHNYISPDDLEIINKLEIELKNDFRAFMEHIYGAIRKQK